MQAISSTPRGFRPEPELVRAAEILFMLMAREGAIREIVEPYQQAILNANNYRVNALKWGAPLGEERITDARSAYLMGDQDFADYNMKCQAAAGAHKLTVRVPGNCPLLEAQASRITAEQLLLELMYPHTRIRPEALTLEVRAELLELSLSLLAPHVDPHKRFGLPCSTAAEEDEGHRPQP